MWLNTAKGLFCLLLSIRFTYAEPIPTYTYPSGYDAEGAAVITNGQVRTYTGSNDDINNNLSRPLMSSEQMTAFDGTPFDSQIACPSTVAFLELFAVPSGTGDISTLTVKQDLDTDGTTDRIYTLPTPVSGVCANGLLACDPGTWNNCQAYQWEASTTGELSLARGALSDLGGCYCINNHCGNNLVMSNLPTVLGDIGGGAANTMAKINPLFTISRVDVSGPVIQYYGQNAGDCGFYGSTNQTLYYSNPAGIPAAASSSTATDVVLPNSTVNPSGTVTIGSMYDLLTTSTAATSDPSQLFNCRVERQVTADEVTMNDILRFNGGTGRIQPCGTGCGRLTLGTTARIKNTSACTFWEKSASIYVSRPDRITSAVLRNVSYDDYARFTVNSTLLHEGVTTWFSATEPFANSATRGCEYGGERNIALNANLMSYFANTGPVEFRVQNASGNRYGYAYALAEVRFNESCMASPDLVINQCASYEKDTACVLVDEVVDGVATYSGYNPTGLVPVPSLQVISGASCSLNETRDWWLKERTYLCQTGSTHTFDNVYERVATIQDSATLTGYDDYRLNEATGSWVSETGNTLSTPNVPTLGNCTQACKTRRRSPSNEVAGMGPAQDMRNLATNYEFFYHACIPKDTCPMTAGEELLQPCQCINDFAEATAVMQAMRMAGRDMICTTGTLVPLQ